MGRKFANESIPAPDDLAGWKRADSLLSSRFADHLANGQRLRSRKAIRRYFDDDDIGYFFTTHEQRGVAMAYSSWGTLDYRPTKNSQTRAEQLIKEGLPRAQAILLEARMDAHPTLYRVVAHSPDKGTVDMEDVLIGGAVTVHDRLLSENIDDGLLIAARTFPVGQYHFFDLIGPPLGAGMALDAVDFLQDCGMVLTPEGLKRDAHKFGWLWIWIDEWQASWRTPRLCNTDGHDLLFHTASFAVDDSPAVREAMSSREDIDFDEDTGEFVWSKTTGKAARIPGGPVTLGRMELIGDELVLTVNSVERFADARQWLTKLPGVKFIDVTTREPHAMGDDQPADERMPDEPVDITPELIDALQDQFDRYYMDWLDQPIPMFGDMTPRQVCQSPEGRERVMMLIRTMPDPGGQVPVRIPRQAMMRELGLATADSQVQAIRDESLRSLAAPSEARAGRNDPCPCGSGRKYKKCCG